MTNTHPTNQLPATPNHLAMLIAALMCSIESMQPSPLPGDPGFEEYLDNQALLQQLELAQYHKACLEVDPDDQAAATGLHKALSLVERSRTRTTRPTKNDPSDAPKTPRERDFAAEFLKAELLPGPRPVSDLIPRARLMGIAAKTLQRAKADLGVHSSLHVMPDKTRFWSWSLPEHAAINEFNSPKPRPGYTYKEYGTIPRTPESESDLGTQTSVSDSTLGTQNSAPSTSAGTIVSNSKTKDGHMAT